MIGENAISAPSAPTMSTRRLSIRRERVMRGVATWMRGRPATCCVWMRGPAMSVSPVLSTSRTWASARYQERWRISAEVSGELLVSTSVWMRWRRTASRIPETEGVWSGASALGISISSRFEGICLRVVGV